MALRRDLRRLQDGAERDGLTEVRVCRRVLRDALKSEIDRLEKATTPELTANHGHDKFPRPHRYGPIEALTLGYESGNRRCFRAFTRNHGSKQVINTQRKREDLRRPR